MLYDIYGTKLTTEAVSVDYDRSVKGVNHRGYSTVAPENTLPAYILSRKMGFQYAECDVSFTADGVPVLLHDSTIDRTSDGSGSIGALTLEEVRQYDFGSWKGEQYAGTKIPTLEEFLVCCKNIGLHPYLELKANGSYTQEQIAAIVSLVREKGMAGKVTYISFSLTFLQYVKEADPAARLGYLGYLSTDALSQSTIDSAIALKTGQNEVFIDASLAAFAQENITYCAENGVGLEVWTVNSADSIKNMNPYISGVTSDSLHAGKVLYNAAMA